LEIQTLGESGLRYRVKNKSNIPGSWHHLSAYTVNPSVDSTGCGDWCSAGLINKLCHNGREEFLALDETTIEKGLQFGQALAAINCKFMGARAPMYQLTKKSLLDEAGHLMK
jgi:fructokinase